jgi:predicted ATPase
MPAALAEHDDILQASVYAADGFIIKTTGDGIFAAFAKASDAVQAAVKAQLTLSKFSWGNTGPLKVRMGLHSGEAQIREDDYFGTAVIRAARIMSLAAGGQILISGTTAAFIRDSLSHPISLKDLGRHRLKGLERPAQIYQIQHPALSIEFPELKTLDSIPNNLPLQLTSFIGRQKEIEEVEKILTCHQNLDNSHRLTTLTGSGGTGKTRLAMRVASDLFENYPDGVWLVELAALTNDAQVPQALVSNLKLGEPRNIAILDLLTSYLRARKVLIILDNCEHLIGACATLCDHLLRNCPKLQILTTSREALGIGGEIIYFVPSLDVNESEDLTAGELLNTEAGQLFAERATAVNPRFSVDENNTEAISQICRRLDGIPLAIELASARVNIFTPQQILKRLDNRFNLLTGGSRAALPRQQTLSALIDWSYELLTPNEKALLRGLSVFKGGWTMDAVEAVAFEDLDALLLFPNLVNKSLVITEESGGNHRYRVLESIRQYALEKLVLENEEAEARKRHLAYFENLAVTNRPQTADIYLDGTWFRRCQQEIDNFRTALTWAIEDDPEAALQICGTLVWFWARRGYAVEGREWLNKVLEVTAKLPEPIGEYERCLRDFGHALAQLGLCQLGIILGDNQTVQKSAQKSVEILRNQANVNLLPFVLGLLAFASLLNNDLEMTALASAEALTMASETGDLAALSLAYGAKSALLARHEDDLAEAQSAAEEGLRYARDSKSGWGQVMTTFTLARVLNAAGHGWFDYRRAFGELIDAFVDLEDFYFANVCRSELAHAERISGHCNKAKTLYKETIVIWQDLGQKAAVAHQLECFAFHHQIDHQYKLAAKLLGAAEVLREQTKSQMIQSELEEYDRYVALLRQNIGSDDLAKSWRIGRRLNMDDAVEWVLEN